LLIFCSFSGYVAVVNRKDSKSSPDEVLQNHEVFVSEPALREKVVIIEDSLQDNLSSTHIRNCLLAGDSVKYLVPDSVHDYLTENQVYTEETMKINSGNDVLQALADNKIARLE